MEKLPIILVTGFLGAGKTTFLQRIITRYRDRAVAYLVNEFASVDIDSSRLVLPADRLLSVAGGSIFCRCKVTDFVNVMRKLTERIAALEAVVIEATGIADPRVFARMLDETGLSEHYRVSRIISIVDPGSFNKLLHTLPNIEHQIASADTILINKADLFDRAEVEGVTEKINSMNSQALIVPTVLADADIELFGGNEKPFDKSQGDYAKCVDPNFCKQAVKIDDVESIEHLRQAIDANADNLYRVKGFVRIGGSLFDIDWSCDTWNVSRGDEVADTSLVIIADSQAAVDSLIAAL